MPLPPWGQVSDMMRHLLGPALGASLVLMLALRLLGRQRFAPVAAALALVGAVLAADHFRNTFEWRIEADRPLTSSDLLVVLGWSLEGKPPVTEVDENSDSSAGPPAEPPRIPPARYWLPWLAGLALLIDLLARLPKVSSGIGWAARTLVALLAGRLLISADLRADFPWASWALGLVILFDWAIFTELTRQWKEGTTAATMALCCGVAAVLLLFADSASLMDLGLLFFAALVGPAVVSWLLPGDTGSALAAAAVFLPGLMLTGQHDTFSQVPVWSFLLVGLAPLAMAPLLLPRLVKLKGWKRCALAICLPLIPAALAIILAARAAPLSFE